MHGRDANPGLGVMLWRGFTKACPVCGRRDLFHWERMVADCPRCGFHFERIEGHWIGAIGINTIVSFGALLLTVVGSMIVTFPDFPVKTLVGLSVGVSIVVPLLFYPSSKTLWTAIDLGMRPAGPNDFERVVQPSTTSSADTKAS